MKMFSVDFLDENGSLQNKIIFANNQVDALARACKSFNPSAIFNATEVIIK